MGLSTAFAGAYAGTRVLVTGHTGFKGSWLCLWLQALGARVAGIALEPDTSPSHWSLLGLDDVEHHAIDLADAARLRAAVAAIRPQVVFHLAAQSLVRRGYRDPAATFAANVTGLINVLEAVRAEPSVRAFVNVTTDKVYLDAPGEGRGYRESDPLGAHDPYSTSKACAELVSECWRQSWLAAAGVRCATARAGNVIGGGDWCDDRLVPDLVRAALAGQPLAIRFPAAVRPWQHVLDPLSGYLLLGQRLLAGEAEGAWNFGPSADATLTVAAMVERMAASWPGLAVAASPGPHPHETALLQLDSAKARDGLGWRPVWSADAAIARTMGWYRAFAADARIASRDDLHAYVADARAAGLGWAA